MTVLKNEVRGRKLPTLAQWLDQKNGGERGADYEPERESCAYLDGEPLKESDPIPTPFIWGADAS